MDMEHFYQRFCKEGFDENGVLSFFEPLPADNFNFAYDVVDELARLEPDRRAMVWCNVPGEERVFTFGEMKQYSDRCAQMLARRGVKKGDKVLLVLKRHYEFWFTVLALHKIGAVGVPATNLLTTKDILYRFEAPVSVRENAASHPMLMRPVRNIRTSAQNGLCAALAKAGSPMMRRCPSVTGTGNG